MKKEEENNLKVSQEENKKLEENIINNKEKSYIIAEINIYNTNKRIRLINSFEQIIREEEEEEEEEDYFDDIKKEEYYKYENEKEIKDNCQIEINNKIIEFSYFYEFKEEGKYIIKYIFLNNITKTDFMFYNCEIYINEKKIAFNYYYNFPY